MTTQPEIRINYAGLLNRSESPLLAKAKGYEMLSHEDAIVLVENYRSEWKKYEKQIIDYICATLGIQFYRDVVDVHIAQFFIPKSEPLIISCMDDPDTFVDTLTHELIHVLLTDNDVLQLPGDDRNYQLADEWASLFGEQHSFTTLVHIPAHALHSKVFADVFKDDARLKRDIKILERFDSTDYLKSWDYVQQVGADDVITKLYENFRKIKYSKGKQS